MYQIFNNEDAEAAGLTNGEIDFAYIDSANILNTLKSKPGISMRGAVVPSFDEIGINTGSAFRPTRRVASPARGRRPGAHRRARAAGDADGRRQRNAGERVLQGYGSAGNSPVQPGATTGAWQPGPNDPDLSFSIDNANALLDQAGYTMGPDTSDRSESNKPLEFRYYTRSRTRRRSRPHRT